ncbi:MAG: transporter substrate-binding domain-containing protein [Tissierellia bacterium]|nr:transporter substrate-binding domain-containing protein [Tissierellia bacterium]
MDVIRICGDMSHPPYEYIDKDSRQTGFASEFTKAMSEEIGIEMELTLLDWPKAVEAFSRGEYDAIQFFSIQQERSKQFLFTDPYLTTFHSVFALSERDDIKDYGDLKDFKVAVQAYDAAHVFMDLDENNYKELMVTNSQEKGLELLMNKEVDLLIGNRLTISYLACEKGYDNYIKIIGKALNMTKYCMAAIPSRPDLLEIFNKGIENLRKNGVYEKLYDKWFTYSSENLGYEILSKIDSGAIYIDAHGKIKAVNKNAERILNIKESDLNSRNFYETDYNLIFEPLIIQEILDGRSETLHKSLDCVINHERKYLEINYNRMADVDHKTIGVVVTVVDITEKKFMEARLAEKDKMESLGFLLLNIAHEIRNPLTSIKNFIELLPEEYEDPEFREAVAYHVPKQIKQIDEMLTNLLEYSRPVKPKISKVNLNKMLKDLIIGSIIKATKDMNVNIYYNIDEDVDLYCDRNHIKQILINLILNAAQAVPIGGNISINVSQNEKEKIISIENDIDDENIDVEKLFEPFYTTKAHGTGLGLFITYQLVRENMGDITVEKVDKCLKISLIFQKMEDYHG